MPGPYSNLPAGYDHEIYLVDFIDNDTSSARTFEWAVETPGAWFDPPGVVDPIIYANPGSRRGRHTRGGSGAADDCADVLGLAGLAFAASRSRGAVATRA